MNAGTDLDAARAEVRLLIAHEVELLVDAVVAIVAPMRDLVAEVPDVTE